MRAVSHTSSDTPCSNTHRLTLVHVACERVCNSTRANCVQQLPALPLHTYALETYLQVGTHLLTRLGCGTGLLLLLLWRSPSALGLLFTHEAMVKRKNEMKIANWDSTLKHVASHGPRL